MFLDWTPTGRELAALLEIRSTCKWEKRETRGGGEPIGN